MCNLYTNDDMVMHSDPKPRGSIERNFYFAHTKDKNEYVCIENKLNGRKTVYLIYIVINVFLDVAIRADRLFRITR